MRPASAPAKRDLVHGEKVTGGDAWIVESSLTGMLELLFELPSMTVSKISASLRIVESLKLFPEDCPGLSDSTRTHVPYDNHLSLPSFLHALHLEHGLLVDVAPLWTLLCLELQLSVMCGKNQQRERQRVPP